MSKEGKGSSYGKKVMVLGGTGFLGYHALQEFLKLGYEVTVLALPPMPREGLLPPEVKVTLADLNELSDDEVVKLLEGQDALVHAAGADDRIVPKAPAWDFFYNANVKASIRLFTLARKAGVKRGVMCSSYFAYFDRIWPEEELAKHHPYVRSRVEQEEGALEAAMPDLELCILELPYIFGSMPGRLPLWEPLVQYVRSPLPLFYMKGGTNMITVHAVGQALAGGIEYGEAGHRYVVGDENLTWVQMMEKFCKAAGKDKKVHILPNWTIREAMRGMHLMHKHEGREGGLDPVPFSRIQTRETFFDPTPAAETLQYTRGGIDKAIQDTVDACPPRSLLKRKKK
ncbi:MAG: NAD-dependent epimerase/dehydratase family protein [Actinobacteria bacterium]|nr:NAD-dependent epimerase/dehydratase family protein [Actinomycetota bacterium]